MKRNLNAPILQLDGTEFPGKNKQTLQSVCFVALTTPQEDDGSLNAETKMSLYRLAQKIVKGGEVELTAEEIALLKDRIGKVFVHVVVLGRAFELLEADASPAEIDHHPV